MRALFWFLVLAALAVGIAIASRLTSGYALFVALPYRVELSLNFFLLLLILLMLGVHVGIRLVQRAIGLPREVRALRRRQQLDRARTRQDAAVIALLEGRYGRAQRLADEALAVPQSSGLPALIAARGAIETRDFTVAEALLARPDAMAPSLAVPRLMLEAELRLEQGQAIAALDMLQSLRKEAGLHTAAMRLELKALQAAGRYAEIPPLVDQLAKRKVYSPVEAEVVRASAHAAELEARRHDSAGLRAYWSRLSDADQRTPRVARAAALSFMALGGDREATDILVRALERTWDPDLVTIFADCRPPDGTRQLEQAERWLTEHNQDSRLMYALGVLCQRQQLWGKAQTYLEASLALDKSYATHLALGELFVRLGRAPEANAHLAAALNLALAQLKGESSAAAPAMAHA